jgi:hypothetical protein
VNLHDQMAAPDGFCFWIWLHHYHHPARSSAFVFVNFVM